MRKTRDRKPGFGSATTTISDTDMKTTISIATIALTLSALSSCGNGADSSASQEQSQRTVSVSVATVDKQIVTGIRNYPATVVPINETELRAEVSGYITSIVVADGAYVRKGQKLYEIDRTRYAAEVDQASANLRIAESNYDRISKDLERYRKLAEQDAIARQTLDYAETDLSNQAAQVEAARAALTTAKTNLQRSTIVAPFDGAVGISQVRNGALVTGGTTLLNTVSSISPIAVEFQINETEIPRIQELQNDGSSTYLEVRLPDGSVLQEQGRISTIDRAIDRSTGTLTVRANFPNSRNTLRAGMNLTMRISSESAEEKAVIPQLAVIEQLGSYNVFVVSDSSTAQFQQVRLGLKFDDRIVVEEGLSVGQQVIVDGANNVTNGDKIVIENKRKTSD